jgi:DNA-directed RNA polymerase II subunit RPB1
MSCLTYPSEIERVQFYVLGDEENEMDSVVRVLNDQDIRDGNAIPAGINDSRMGAMATENWLCGTCGNNKKVCPGHFGSAQLKYPVKSPLFRKEIPLWLKVICFKCGMPVVELKKHVEQSKQLSELAKQARAAKKCMHCGAPYIQIAVDKKKPAVINQIIDENPVELHNHKILEILSQVSPEVVERLGKPALCHPRKFILQNIRIPPNNIRPDTKRKGGTRVNKSDTSSLLQIIMKLDKDLPPTIPPDDQIDMKQSSDYLALDMFYFAMIKGGGGGEIKILANTEKPPMAIAEKLPKKPGRIRGNLGGKRVRYMARAVIAGDPRLGFNEVGIPLAHAMTLDVPETVTSYNFERLNRYYLNGPNKYPGCKRIIKGGHNGNVYSVEYLAGNYVLQIGDVVLRHMIDGDWVNFNRQPSLLFSNISCMRIKVTYEGSSFTTNPLNCAAFNADFDGDQMNIIVPSSPIARFEIATLSRLSNWFISMQNHSPMFGVFQDSLCGTAKMTREGTYLNRRHAMNLFANVELDKIAPHLKKGFYEFDADLISSRELISRILPDTVEIKKRPKIFKELYAPYVKYNPSDIDVVVKGGELLSGVLDKSTVGQGAMGGIFHIIGNEHGNEYALASIHSMQQISHQFLLYSGYTVGIRDIMASEGAIKEIKRRIAAMFLESRKITQKLDSGKLIPPIGMKLRDFYEMEQLRVLSPGDDFIAPILADSDFNNNGILQLISSGSKGKDTNFSAIGAAIGQQTVDGERFKPQVGWGRTSCYFPRFDMEPEASGYIPTSFREGIENHVYSFASGEARDGAIKNAFSTSQTGYQNRISVKLLESNRVGNRRQTMKTRQLVQPLYADWGVDPAKTEKTKFRSIAISDKQLKEQYDANYPLDDLKIPTDAKTEQAYAEEFMRIKEDREYFRRIHLTLEKHNPREYIMDTAKQMPVDVERLIRNTVNKHKKNKSFAGKGKSALDVHYAMRIIRELCENLGYVYYNEEYKKQKLPIAPHIVVATKLMQVLVRSCLCVKQLLIHEVNNFTLDIIVLEIVAKYKRSLIEYGKCVGVLAAQCISEPQTQFVLDSKHRTGGLGGTKTNEIDRIKEIFGVRSTASMKNPKMLIMLKPEYEKSQAVVQEIATQIEMMRFKQFVKSTQISFEEFGKPVHPKLVEDLPEIEDILQIATNLKIPSDLGRWCIKFGIDREALLLKSMKLSELTSAVRRLLPEVFLLATPESFDNLWIRCYIHTSMVKNIQGTFYEDVVLPLREKIEELEVRGISGITSAEVIKVIQTREQEDGSLKPEKVLAIATAGTNLEEVLMNPYVDPSRTQSDSIAEIEEIFGITALRNKVINEMIATLNTLNRFHCTVFADEMALIGTGTSIHSSGLKKREAENVLLQMSFQTPVQVVQNAAINGRTNPVGGISGRIMLGTNPRLGTCFNKVVVDQDAIEMEEENLGQALDEL